MGKTESIRIKRGLSLYKQPLAEGRGSPNLYSRVYMPINGRNIHTRSTGTTDVALAIKRAEEFYLDCLLWKRGDTAMPLSLVNRQDPARRFDRVFDEYIDELEKEAGSDEQRLGNLRNKKQLYNGVNGFARFFGKDDISSITTARMKEFLRFHVEHSKYGKLASSTQKKALIALGLVLKYAAEKGLIAHVPALPKIKEVDQPRGWFSLDQYRSLHAMCRKLAQKARQDGDPKEVEAWREMEDFVVFMVNSFLRASEWASLKQRHISVVGGDKPHLKIAVIKGKTGLRYTISMPRAVEVYERIRKRHGNDPDAYLFLNGFTNRETARDRMRDRFEVLLDKAKLKRTALGQTRVIHSLRHTAIMLRLIQHVDPLTVAKNAGTSVDQIERFYGSHLTAEMKLDELHKMAS